MPVEGLGGQGQGVDPGFRTKTGVGGHSLHFDLDLVGGRGADDHMIDAGGIQGVAVGRLRAFCIQDAWRRADRSPRRW